MKKITIMIILLCGVMAVQAQMDIQISQDSILKKNDSLVVTSKLEWFAGTLMHNSLTDKVTEQSIRIRIGTNVSHNFSSKLGVDVFGFLEPVANSRIHYKKGTESVELKFNKTYVWRLNWLPHKDMQIQFGKLPTLMKKNFFPIPYTPPGIFTLVSEIESTPAIADIGLNIEYKGMGGSVYYEGRDLAFDALIKLGNKDVNVKAGFYYNATKKNLGYANKLKFYNFTFQSYLSNDVDNKVAGYLAYDTKKFNIFTDVSIKDRFEQKTEEHYKTRYVDVGFLWKISLDDWVVDIGPSLTYSKEDTPDIYSESISPGMYFRVALDGKKKEDR